jgi:N-acetylneuraminic acid mutarotase
VRFNLFHEKKRKDLKILSALNDFIKPNPYFVYYMFKDTIHVDDYGSIKETLFKFPSLNKGPKSQAHIYLFGDDINSKVSLCYDINEDEWSIKKLPDNTSHKFYQCSASIALNPTEILITGGGSPPKKDARIYLTQKNEILNKSQMTESRNAHAITICKGAVFVLGGFSGKQRLCSVEKYNIREDKWYQVAPMKDKRHYLSACSIGDEHIYAFGGFYGSTEQEINDSIEMYEVEKNLWQVLSVRMKNTLWACSALAISNTEILLIGGKNTNRNGEVHLFNVNSKSWKPLHHMN